MNCKDCGKENIADIHTCSPQLKPLSDEEIDTIREALLMIGFQDAFINYHLKEEALAILKKASEK